MRSDSYKDGIEGADRADKVMFERMASLASWRKIDSWTKPLGLVSVPRRTVPIVHCIDNLEKEVTLLKFSGTSPRCIGLIDVGTFLLHAFRVNFDA